MESTFVQNLAHNEYSVSGITIPTRNLQVNFWVPSFYLLKVLYKSLSHGPYIVYGDPMKTSIQCPA